MKRLFLAAKIPEAARIAASALINDLRREYPEARVSWVRPENLHITIKFLGETREERITDITEAATKACAAFPMPRVRFGESGSFGDRILHISIRDDSDILLSIYRDLETRLANAGFKKEKRPFRSHLTIGRIRSDKDIKPLISYHRSVMTEPVEFDIRELTLFESILDPKGSIYREVEKFPFAGEHAISRVPPR